MPVENGFLRVEPSRQAEGFTNGTLIGARGFRRQPTKRSSSRSVQLPRSATRIIYLHAPPTPLPETACEVAKHKAS